MADRNKSQDDASRQANRQANRPANQPAADPRDAQRGGAGRSNIEDNEAADPRRRGQKAPAHDPNNPASSPRQQPNAPGDADRARRSGNR